MRQLTGFIGACAAMVGPWVGGSAYAVEPAQVREIVVTGARDEGAHGATAHTPRRTESVDARSLARQGVTRLEDALAWLSAGQSVRSTGVAASMVIDGLSASHLTLLRDGLPFGTRVNSIGGPIYNVSAIPIHPSTIERIDVYRGLGPAGSGDAGGVVVDVITRIDPDPYASGRIAVRTDGGDLYDQSYAVGVGSPLGERVVMSLDGAFGRVRALDVNGDGVFNQPRMDSGTGQARLRWSGDGGRRLQLVASHTGTDTASLGDPRGPLFDRTLNHATDVSLSARFEAPQWTVRPTLQLIRTHHRFYKRVRSSGFDRLKSDTSQVRVRQSTVATRDIGEHQVGIEASIDGTRVERTGETGDLPARFLGAAGAGANGSWRAHRDVVLDGRIYGEGHTRFGGDVLAQVSVGYRPVTPLTVRGSISRTRRAPSPEELFLAFDHAELGYQLEGNPALGPERLHSGRLGIVLTNNDGNVGVETEVFAHHITDGIVSSPIGTENSVATFTYENVSRARAVGLNTSARLSAVPGGLSLRISHTYLPIADDVTTGARLPLRALHSVRGEVHGAWWSGRFQLWVRASTRSALPVPEGQPGAPAYLLLTAGVGSEVVAGVHLNVEANNLTNQTNAIWGPAPGLGVFANLEVRMQRRP